MLQYFDKLVQGLAAHHVIYALLIIIGMFLVAYILDRFVKRLLERYSGKARASSVVHLIKLFHPSIYNTILFLAILLVINVIEIGGQVIEFSHSLIITLLILIWARVFVKLYEFIIQKHYRSRKAGSLVNKQTKPLFDGVVKVVACIVAIYFVLLSWGIQPTGLVTSLGVGGLVLGIAAKDSLSNVFAGMFLLADAPYVKGDYVNLESGERGYIDKVGLRSTRILTRDDVEIIVPNSVIATSKVINESGGPKEHERIRVNIGVGYDSNMDQVEKLLIDIATNNERICKEPLPRVRFREFGDSALKLQLMFWIEFPGDRGKIVHEVNKEILSSFRKKGITIPSPEMTVNIKK